MKSTLRVTGEILILIGAILTTIFQALSMLTFFFLIIPVIWGTFVIVFTWVTRHIVLKHNSLGWIIFGIVLSVFTNWVGLAGYICILIDKIRLEQVPQSTKYKTSPFEQNFAATEPNLNSEETRFETEKE